MNQKPPEKNEKKKNPKQRNKQIIGNKTYLLSGL